MLKLLLLVLVAVAVWYVVTRVRTASRAPVAFTAVEDLPVEARDAVDAALRNGEVGAAVKHYRAATGADLVEARAAIDVRQWKQSG